MQVDSKLKEIRDLLIRGRREIKYRIFGIRFQDDPPLDESTLPTGTYTEGDFLPILGMEIEGSRPINKPELVSNEVEQRQPLPEKKLTAKQIRKIKKLSQPKNQVEQSPRQILDELINDPEWREKEHQATVKVTRIDEDGKPLSEHIRNHIRRRSGIKLKW
jgi:hypothetical protein